MALCICHTALPYVYVYYDDGHTFAILENVYHKLPICVGEIGVLCHLIHTCIKFNSDVEFYFLNFLLKELLYPTALTCLQISNPAVA